MKSISVSEMRELEENTFNSGVTVLELMERAGKECARLIEEKIQDWKQETGYRKLSVVLFCGPGNNGGDGLVCARYLKNKGFDVSVVLPIAPKTEVAKTNLKRAEEAHVRIVRMEEIINRQTYIVIDALLGIGAKGELRGLIKEACILINEMKANGCFVISLDVPTGLDADSGECDPGSVKANATICIHAPKTGEVNARKQRTGELWIADIGL